MATALLLLCLSALLLGQAASSWGHHGRTQRGGGQQQQQRRRRHLAHEEDEQGGRRLPTAIRDWNYPELMELVRNHGMFAAALNHSETATRFWDRAGVRYGSQASNPEQFRPLLEKLRRGERMVVTAIGSSIVSSFAGCYQRSLADVAELVGSLGVNYAGSCQTHYPGWIYSFMQWVNQTYPHPNHVMVNNGWSGAGLNTFAYGSCIEANLPGTTDLIIIEQHNWAGWFGNDTGGVTHGEILLWRLYSFYRDRQPHPPAVILLNTVWVIEHLVANPWGDEGLGPSFGCIKNQALCSSSKCREGFQHMVNEQAFGPSHADLIEDQLVPWANYYGISMVSFRNFLYGCLRDGVAAALQLDDCMFFTSMLGDPIHPSRLGQLLLADMLVNQLVEAQEYFDLQEEDPAFEEAEAALAGWRLPTLPYTPKGHDTFVIRCYGFDADREMPTTRFDPASKKWTGNSTDAVPQNLGLALGAFDVLRSEGWSVVEWQVHGEDKKYKPGWVSETPGSVLVFRVDSLFTHLASSEKAKVVLSYLDSYEHMGTAAISCVGGCDCSRTVVDAHNPAERTSLNKIAVVVVTQAAMCDMMVEVLPETRSGEHKFKLVQVLVKALSSTFAGNVTQLGHVVDGSLEQPASWGMEWQLGQTPHQ